MGSEMCIRDSNPSTNLHVVGGIRATTAFDLRDTDGNVILFVEDASNDARISNQTAGEDIIVRTTPSGGSATERLRIDSSGNMGLGSDSPSTRLHVKPASDVTTDGIRVQRQADDGQFLLLNYFGGTGQVAAVDTAGSSPTKVVFIEMLLITTN